MTAPPDFESVDLALLYSQARARVGDLVSSGGVEDVHVPCCPEWNVHGVLSHLVAVSEDANAGKLSGPPTDEVTAGQVAARSDKSVAQLLSDWDAAALQLEGTIREHRVWPLFLDVLAHEHDIRGAVGQPAGRDGDAMTVAGAWLMSHMGAPVPMIIRVDGTAYEVGDGEPALELDTDPFEAFRFRLGRRSRNQLAAMNWTGDPAPVLDQLAIFGPSPLDISE